MSLSQDLAAATGLYFGTGHGDESGTFVSRIEIGLLPNGGVSIGYEATSVEQGVQHLEQTMLVAGPDGRDRLYVAHSESPFVTEMIETEPASGRFAQREPFGPYQRRHAGRAIQSRRHPAVGVSGSHDKRARLIEWSFGRLPTVNSRFFEHGWTTMCLAPLSCGVS